MSKSYVHKLSLVSPGAEQKHGAGRMDKGFSGQYLARFLGVKHVDDVDSKVPLQPAQVALPAMEHLLQRRVGKGRPQQRHVLVNCQNVQDVVFTPVGQLHEAGAAQVAVQRMMLEVHCHPLPAGNDLQQ